MLKVCPIVIIGLTILKYSLHPKLLVILTYRFIVFALSLSISLPPSQIISKVYESIKAKTVSNLGLRYLVISYSSSLTNTSKAGQNYHNYFPHLYDKILVKCYVFRKRDWELKQKRSVKLSVRLLVMSFRCRCAACTRKHVWRSALWRCNFSEGMCTISFVAFLKSSLKSVHIH